MKRKSSKVMSHFILIVNGTRHSTCCLAPFIRYCMMKKCESFALIQGKKHGLQAVITASQPKKQLPALLKTFHIFQMSCSRLFCSQSTRYYNYGEGVQKNVELLVIFKTPHFLKNVQELTLFTNRIFWELVI